MNERDIGDATNQTLLFANHDFYWPLSAHMNEYFSFWG